MAILREGIQLGNSYVEQMKIRAKELASISNDVISYLNGNGNFQIFKDGTERGARIYNDLNTCVSTIVDKLVPTIEKISMTTTNLLNTQENLNRADDGGMNNEN